MSCYLLPRRRVSCTRHVIDILFAFAGSGRSRPQDSAKKRSQLEQGDRSRAAPDITSGSLTRRVHNCARPAKWCYICQAATCTLRGRRWETSRVAVTATATSYARAVAHSSSGNR